MLLSAWRFLGEGGLREGCACVRGFGWSRLAPLLQQGFRPPRLRPQACRFRPTRFVVLSEAGLPPARHEYPLPTTSDLRGFVDRAWPEVRFIIEADGRRWHTRRADFARDAQRDLEASALGWHTLRVTWEMLRFDPEVTAALIRSTYEERVRLHLPPPPTG